MSKEQKSDASETTSTTKTAREVTDAGVEQLQETFDKATERGFIGVETDPTDNRILLIS